MGWLPHPDLLLISPTAIGFLPPLILHLVVLGYLLNFKGKSHQTWFFTGWLAGLTLLMVSCFVGYTIYAPLGGYIYWMGGIIASLFAVTMELQFTYRFPRLIYAREARLGLIVSLAIIGGMIVLMAIEAMTIPIQTSYAFDSFMYGLAHAEEQHLFASANLFNIAHLAGHVWVLVVWLRKAIHFHPRNQASGPWWQRLGETLWQPQGKEAQLTRTFILLMIAASLSVVVEILEAERLLPPGSFSVSYMLAISGIVLAYIDNAPEPSTFMIKLVGISLVTLLAIFGLVNPHIFQAQHETYEQIRQAELVHIKTLMSAKELPASFANVPEQVLYIAARPVAEGLFSSTYHLLFSRLENLSAQTLEQEDAHLKTGWAQGRPAIQNAVLDENPWLRAEQGRDGSDLVSLRVPAGQRGYRGIFAGPEGHYIRYAFTSEDEKTLYEVGYSYPGYRRMLHRQAMLLIYLMAGATLLILFVFPRFFKVSLVKPLGDLLEGVRRLHNTGDLNVTVPIRTEDEIGFLVRSFNELVRSLRILNAELRLEISERSRAEAEVRALNVSLEQRVTDRTRELAALYAVSAVASRVHDLETLLAESLSRGLEAMQGQAGAICLLEELASPPTSLPAKATMELSTLRVMAHQGLPTPLVWEALFNDGGLVRWVIESREPLLVPDLAADPRVPSSLLQVEAQSLIVAPLRADGQVLGLLGLIRQASFKLEEVALLSSIADQVGVAVQSNRLRRQAQQVAIMEERQRLARDLHDSVTQSLYGLVTLTEAGQAHLATRTLDAVDNIFAVIGKTARLALKEMRLFIHQSRPSMLIQEGLVGALHLRLAAVEGRSDIQARLLADETIKLPLEAETALYHIAQEALNNALRHAGAASVTIYLRCEGRQVILEIVDDGCGFDPGTVNGGGMGLINMRQRANEVRGVLDVTSKPGAGTRVKVTVAGQGEL